MDDKQNIYQYLMDFRQSQNSDPSNLSSTTTQGGGLPITPQAIKQPQSTQSQPDDVVKAQQYVDNKDMNQYPQLCQAFVEKVTGSGWQGTSAIDAWNNQQDKAVADPNLQGIKPGDLVYFTPTNQVQAGHVGIWEGNDQFVSATGLREGIAPKSLGEWQDRTGQTPLGYIPQGGK